MHLFLLIVSELSQQPTSASQAMRFFFYTLVLQRDKWGGRLNKGEIDIFAFDVANMLILCCFLYFCCFFLSYLSAWKSSVKTVNCSNLHDSLTDLSVKYSHTSHVFLCSISLISWIWSRREQQGRGSIHQPASGGKINVRLYSYRPVVLSACLLVCLNCSNRFRFEIEAFCRWFCVCVCIRSRWSCWAGLKSSWLSTIKSTAVRRVSDWISFIPRMDIVSHSCLNTLNTLRNQSLFGFTPECKCSNWKGLDCRQDSSAHGLFYHKAIHGVCGLVSWWNMEGLPWDRHHLGGSMCCSVFNFQHLCRRESCQFHRC